ncbi:unnamed protein product, partial [Protopolystoma xenopodis]
DLVCLCCLCGKTFPNQRLLHKHFQAAHEEEDEIKPDGLIAEIKNEALCPKEDTFSQSKSLACNSCGKVFTKSCNLNSHIKAVHRGTIVFYLLLGVKSFECPHCFKGFSRNSDLQKHVDAVHKGTWHSFKTFQDFDPMSAVCVVKGFRKSLASSATLKLYTKVIKIKNSDHLGIKSYQCLICLARFSYDVHLRRHVRSKHKGNVISGAPSSSSALWSRKYSKYSSISQLQSSSCMAIDLSLNRNLETRGDSSTGSVKIDTILTDYHAPPHQDHRAFHQSSHQSDSAVFSSNPHLYQMHEKLTTTTSASGAV